MKIKILLLFLLFSTLLAAQRDILPVGMTADEIAMMKWQSFVTPGEMRSIPEPPPYPVRAMAEWEELQGLTITWRSFPNVLKEVVRYAKEEVPVIIVCRNAGTMIEAQNTLLNSGITLDNLDFVIEPNNSVWIRDYGPNCVYANDVEELYFIDWIYNRPTRPQDDVLPDALGEYLGIPVYNTTGPPDDMVNTGGNYMSDGQGNAFASKLILSENKPGNIYGAGPHDEAEIDAIMQAYMGIDRFIKMETLPFDAIHHIDMHMKLLDEETLLVGQYPANVSDGPQIEANIEYVLNNFNSTFGEPYKIVRVLQPPDFDGTYPPAGDYRTYANSVFVNKTILVPIYEEAYDTIGLRIYRENFPGYKVVGIDCNEMIWASGALHCIAREIGVADPLLIVHQRLKNLTDNELQDDYKVDAKIQHLSGIGSAGVFFTTDTLLPYQPVTMTLTDSTANIWTGYIPHQDDSSEVFYYIHATAISGKTQVRPLPAPAGYYHFTIDATPTATVDLAAPGLGPIYPNPASAVTVVPVYSAASVRATIEVVDVLGRVVATLFDGQLPAGNSNHFLQAQDFSAGTYFVNLKTAAGIQTQKLVVK
jgi:agmatine deiminase